MKAAEAKTVSEHAEREAREREWKKKSDEQRAISVRASDLLNKEYPNFVRKIRSGISAATKRGERHFTTSYNELDYKMVENMTKELRADDYKVSTNYSEGYVDYGDTEAPCNVWETHRSLTVEW